MKQVLNFENLDLDLEQQLDLDIARLESGDVADLRASLLTLQHLVKQLLARRECTCTCPVDVD